MAGKSKQREAILRVLKETTAHPTAEQIYEQVRKEIPNISLGTVYRHLRLLKEEGRISELDVIGAFSRYDAKTENHYHFICEQCGNIFDLDEPVDRDLDEKVARKTGFKVSNHSLAFHGLCKDCQTKKRP